jgi:hypothetical protein
VELCPDLPQRPERLRSEQQGDQDRLEPDPGRLGQPDAGDHRHRRHAERGQQLQRERGQERDPQRLERRPTQPFRRSPDGRADAVTGTGDLHRGETLQHREQLAGQAGQCPEPSACRRPCRQADQHHEDRDQRQGHEQHDRRGGVDRHDVDDDGDGHDDPGQQRRQVAPEGAVQRVDPVGQRRCQRAGVLFGVPRRAAGEPGDDRSSQARLDPGRGAVGEDLGDPGRCGADEHRGAEPPQPLRVVRQGRVTEEGARHDRPEGGGLHDQRDGGDERQHRPEREEPGNRRIEAQQTRVDRRSARPVPQPLPGQWRAELGRRARVRHLDVGLVRSSAGGGRGGHGRAA